jgi:lipopolysaccharide assembly protein A
MVRVLRLILALIALVVIIAFAIANRAPVDVSFAPLPIVIELPVYGVFLFGLVFGMLLGAIWMLLAGAARRREARRLRNKTWALENQLSALRQEEERARAEERAAPARSTALARAG